MSIFDSADLLARVQRDSGVVAGSTFPATSDWYGWLSAAQMEWKPKLAAEYPYAMFNAPTIMTTSDSGVTYQFPGGEIAPLAVEIYPSLTGERMTVGQFSDPNADYVWEVSQIRMPMNQTRGFSDGAPYARWVSAPGVIDASTQPTMQPLHTRQLLVDRALVYFCKRGGLRDPKPFLDGETKTWADLQESLKGSNIYYGDAANRSTGKLRGVNYLLARRG